MPRIPPSVAAALLVAAVAIGPDPCAATLTPELLVDSKHVTDVTVAPAGHRVAYTLEVPRGADEPPGRSRAELWIVDAAGGSRRYVGGHLTVHGPRFSPDGQRVSFRMKDGDSKTAGLYSIPLDGGEKTRLLDHPDSIEAHAWSPDGRFIAFVARDGDSENERADKDAGRDWKVFGSNLKYRRLWLYDVQSGDTRRWLDQDLDVSGVAWWPDGKGVVIRAAETPHVDDEYMFSKLYRVTLDGAAQVLTPTAGKLGALAPSPDSRWLAFLAATSLNDPLAQSLFVAPAAGGPARNLTEGLAASAVDLAWSRERGLLLLVAEETRHVLYHVDIDSGVRRSLPLAGLIVRDLDARGATVAVAANSAAHPDEVFVLVDGAPPERLTRHAAAFESLRLARQETIRWPSVDEWTISGVLTYPLDYEEERRYPLVLQVHGGPEGVSLDGWTSSPGYPVQLLAARGFAVLEPNYRGSQGRGVAFSKADHDDLGGKEFDDVLAGIDYLVDRGLVDPARVGTGGWSYGGYLSAWAATRHSARFKAAVVAAGLTNWIAFAGTTDIPYEMSLVHWDSWWFDEVELHWGRSPLAHLADARTPTLIVHGEEDERVHPEQGLELYTALRIKGVPTRLVFYPREPHGLNERAHRLDFIERVLGWFEEYLGGAR